MSHGISSVVDGWVSMAPATACLLVGTVFVAALIHGVSAVGFGLVVAPLLGLLRPELLPITPLLLMAPLNGYIAWRERAGIDPSGAVWITVGRVAGTFGGLWILSVLSADSINRFIGVVALVAAASSIALTFFSAGPTSFMMAGLATGIAETSTGVAGPYMALVYQHYASHTLRSTVAVCLLVGEITSLGMLALSGRLAMEPIVGAIVLLPALAVGASLSNALHKRVPAKVLRYFVIVFAVACGVILVTR